MDPHFPGRRRRLGFSGNHQGRHLGLGIFLQPLLKAEQGAEKGFLFPYCILLIPNKLLNSSLSYVVFSLTRMFGLVYG